MKKGKRLSKADGLRVLIGAYNAIECRRELTMCAAITETADMLGLVDRKNVLAYELIPELRMFKPINSRIEEIWFDFSDKYTRLGDYIPFYTKKMRNDIHLYETLYWVSPIPSTGCTRVRSPDSFTELNVFDFTYPTNVLG